MPLPFGLIEVPDKWPESADQFYHMIWLSWQSSEISNSFCDEVGIDMSRMNLDGYDRFDVCFHVLTDRQRFAICEFAKWLVRTGRFKFQA